MSVCSFALAQNKHSLRDSIYDSEAMLIFYRLKIGKARYTYVTQLEKRVLPFIEGQCDSLRSTIQNRAEETLHNDLGRCLRHLLYRRAATKQRGRGNAQFNAARGKHCQYNTMRRCGRMRRQKEKASGLTRGRSCPASCSLRKCSRIFKF